jgi:hypothetical protein
MTRRHGDGDGDGGGTWRGAPLPVWTGLLASPRGRQFPRHPAQDRVHNPAVMPAQAGIHVPRPGEDVDPRLRGGDEDGRG